MFYYLSEVVVNRAMLDSIGIDGLNESLKKLITETIDVTNWFVDLCDEILMALSEKYLGDDFAESSLIEREISDVLGFDEVHDNDDHFEIGGLNVVMNKAHAIYLLGMQVDFVSGLDNRGFTFENPNASSTCGCGTSFSA